MVDIKNISGNILFSTPINEGCKRKFTLMKEDYISLKFSLESPIYFKLGDYCNSDFGLFEICSIQKPVFNTDTAGYDYELKLDAYYWKWNNKIFKYTPETAGQESSWNLTATLDVHAGIVLRNLKALGYKYNGLDFIISIDNTVENKPKVMSYDNIHILDACFEMAKEWDCECWITENIIHFGRCELGDSVPFEIGVNVEEMSRSDSQSDYATRIYAFGSTKNIPANYRPVDETVVVNGVVQRRLMLPSGTPFIDAYPDMRTEEAIEQVVIFEEVFPRRTGTMSDITTKEYTDKIENADGTTTEEKWDAYRFKDAGIIFSKDYVLPGEELRIIFHSGVLNGMSFAVTFDPDGNDEQLWEIVRNEDYGRPLPGDVLIPSNGDTYILSGWDSTKIAELGLVAAAEQELKTETDKYVAKSKIDPSTYNCTLSESPLYDIGQKVDLINKAYFENGRQSRIIGVEYNLDMPFDHPVYTVGEVAAYSRIGELEDKVDNLTLKGQTFTGGSGSGVYLITSNDSTPATDSNTFSARRMLKMFLRKDQEDVAAKHISFEDGIDVKNGISTDSLTASNGVDVKNGVTTDTLSASANVSSPTATISDKTTTLNLLVQAVADIYDLNVSHVATLFRTTIKDYISSELYTSGLTGSGMKLYKALNGDWNLELDNVVIRKAMTVFELIISKIRAVNGGLVISPANGKVKSVLLTNGIYRLEIEGDMMFVADDLVRCQTFTKTGSKYYWVRITSVSGAYVFVNATEFTTSLPTAGDDLVQFGNKTNALRQGIIYLTASEDGKPRISVLDGVNSTDLAGKTKVILGCLDGVVDSDFPADAQPSGYGLYAQNVFLKGLFVLRNGKSVESEITATNDAVQTAQSVADAAQTAANNAQTEAEKVRTEYKSDFSVLSGKVESKVSQTDFNALGNRVSSAESSITQLPNQIALSVTESKQYTDGKVDSVEVGGVNLVRNSNSANFASYSGSVIESQTTGISVPEWGATDANRVIVTGGTMVLVAVKSLMSPVPPKDSIFSQSGYFKNNSAAPIIISMNAGERRVTIAPGEAKRIVYEGNVQPSSTATIQFQIRSSDVGVGVDFTWWRFKVEYGNKATYWTAAPEDVDAEIATAKTAASAAQSTANQAKTDASTAQTAANNAQSSANTANSLLTDIANDNKLTANEKQETKKEWDAIISEYSKNITQAGKFSVSTTSYTSAYNSLNTYITPLLSNLTTTSNITGTDFRAKFKAYYDARTDLLNAISVKAKDLADAAQTAANNAKTEAEKVRTEYKSDFSVLSGKVESKVSQTDFNALGSRVSSAESSITQLPNQIALSVTESKQYTDGKVDNIQVGGRNLLPNSDFSKSDLSRWYKSSDGNYTISIDNGELVIVGAQGRTQSDLINSADTAWYVRPYSFNEDSEYTLSFEAYALVECVLYLRANYIIDSGNKGSADIGTTKKKYSIVFKNKPYGDTRYLRFVFSKATTLFLDNVKLEIGNKATDWSPAPEDVDAEIATAKTAATNAQTTANQAKTDASTAQTAANNAQTSANTANSLLTDIANDNKLTANEKQETQREWDVIMSEKVKNDASADKFGVSKAAYGTAYTALNTYITPLLTSLTTTSNITGTDFRAKFKAYYDARTDLLNAISVKAKDLADAAQTAANNAKTEAEKVRTEYKSDFSVLSGKVESKVSQTDFNALGSRVSSAESSITQLPNQIALSVTESKQYTDGKVDNIQVGGRNLSIMSQLSNTVFSVLNGIPAYSDIVLGSKKQSFKGNHISINEFNDSVDVAISYYNSNSDFIGSTYNSDGAKYMTSFPVTRDVPANTAFIAYNFRKKDSSAFPPSEINIIKVIIERGNKSTDWSPAPEDVDAEIALRPTTDQIKAEFTIDPTGISMLGKKIALTGMVTFTSLDASAQATINSKVTGNDIATKLGYSNYTDMINKATAGKTIINGGYINTNLVKADEIVTKMLLCRDSDGNIVSAVNREGDGAFRTYYANGQMQMEFRPTETNGVIASYSPTGLLNWKIGAGANFITNNIDSWDEVFLYPTTTTGSGVLNTTYLVGTKYLHYQAASGSPLSSYSGLTMKGTYSNNISPDTVTVQMMITNGWYTYAGPPHADMTEIDQPSRYARTLMRYANGYIVERKEVVFDA